MMDPPNTDWLERYARQGYVHLPAVFARDEVA